MARGVNKVIIVGNLGADPEMRQTAAGMAVANLSVATSEQWTDKSSGEKRENTEWHRVVMFGRLGEIAGQYLRKGSQIYLEGRLQTRKWQGQDGQDRYSTEIVANEMQMLGGRGGESGRPDSGGPDSDFGAPPGPGGRSGGAGRGGPSGGYGNDDSRSRPAPAADTYDDDVPF